ncbi:hypothetical protein VTJ49DRAFT_1723 [Mycothermus thermophilus]|uniref:Uncharacterized protein n=1 Tax=Humicola insolens TaxID=85995 RepID=A0ABR3VC89_HUMIN
MSEYKEADGREFATINFEWRSQCVVEGQSIHPEPRIGFAFMGNDPILRDGLIQRLQPRIQMFNVTDDADETPKLVGTDLVHLVHVIPEYIPLSEEENGQAEPRLPVAQEVHIMYPNLAVAKAGTYHLRVSLWLVPGEGRESVELWSETYASFDCIPEAERGERMDAMVEDEV